MQKLFSSIALIVIGLMVASTVRAGNPQDESRPKGTWFAGGIYSFNIANTGFTYSRVGAMGGYLGNWGGYAKVAFDLVGNTTPVVSAGFTKRLATFRHLSSSPRPSTLHLYFGLGYANVEHASEDWTHDHLTHPDGSVTCVPGTERRTVYWQSSAGLLVDAGLMFRYRRLNFNLGYSLGADVLGGLFGSGDSANHSIQIGIGYNF